MKKPNIKQFLTILTAVAVMTFCGCAAFEAAKDTGSKVGTALTDFVFKPSATDTNASEVSPEATAAIHTVGGFFGPIGSAIAGAVIGGLAVWARFRRPATAPPPPSK